MKSNQCREVYRPAAKVAMDPETIKAKMAAPISHMRISVTLIDSSHRCRIGMLVLSDRLTNRILPLLWTNGQEQIHFLLRLCFGGTILWPGSSWLFARAPGFFKKSSSFEREISRVSRRVYPASPTSSHCPRSSDRPRFSDPHSHHRRRR